MRAYILLAAFILVISSGGYWATNYGTPVAGKDKVTVSADNKAAGLKKDTRTHYVSAQSPLPQQADVKDAQVYDMKNPADKEQMATTLRAEGISEEEVQRILNPIAREASPAIEANVAEAESYDMNNPADKELMATSLRAEGVSEKEIHRIQNPIARKASPPIEAHVAEAESYDMNNPVDKEQMAASLKIEGVPEKDIQQILRHAATEPNSQLPMNEANGAVE